MSNLKEESINRLFALSAIFVVGFCPLLFWASANFQTVWAVGEVFNVANQRFMVAKIDVESESFILLHLISGTPIELKIPLRVGFVVNLEGRSYEILAFSSDSVRLRQNP